MQFNQKALTRVGIAIAVVLAAALFRWIGGTPTEEPSAPMTSERQSAPDSKSVDATEAPPQITAAAAPPVSQGDFAYYVLVLSWSPTYCASDAGQGAEDDRQCRAGRPFGFVLHGLWPQYEHGYPQSCATSEPRVSAKNMARALKIAPSENLVQHEWEKHGTCSGLRQDDYFTSAIAAYRSVHVPNVYVAPERPIVTTADDVRAAFLGANPDLTRDEISATCSRNELAEVWLCLDKTLQPRACERDVRKRHCGARQVHMLAVRGDWP